MKILKRIGPKLQPGLSLYCNPAISAKSCWTILKAFYSGKKIPLIPPLVINDRLITDIRVKANYFNLYFAKQCAPIENDSFIPTETNCLCDAAILAVDFEDQDILKIIQVLDINKAHGHDNISARMIKISDSSIVKPLSIIFYNSLNSEIFPDNWKGSNIVPVHEKGNKELIKNYCPVSLLPISSKIFERLILNSLYKFVEENSLFCSNQLGFRKADSWVNQLLSFLHKIYESFNNFPSLEMHSKFLDMSKAFDRVWYINWRQLVFLTTY